MGIHTNIAWTNASHNFWVGCHKVSPACRFCYAEREMKRYGQDFLIVRKTKKFREPLKWAKTPKLVFTCSWSDFYHEGADGWRDEAWEVIEKTPHLTWQILTKRPERIIEMPHLPNYWLGVSTEMQIYAEERIPLILDTPAAVKFISCEPLLGKLNLERWLGTGHNSINWVITGGESGTGARPFNEEWALNLKDQCAKYSVPFFVKQMGEPWANEVGAKHRHGGDMSEWPQELRVRQMPKGINNPTDIEESV